MTEETTDAVAPEVQIEQLTDLLKRKQAEFENYQKRMRAQNEEMARFATQSLIAKLVPALDVFDLSLQHTKDVDQFIQGVRLIRQQIATVFADEGVSTQELLGTQFDPMLAEAVKIIHTDKPDNEIVEVVAKPYLFHGKLIRAGKVVVNKHGENNDKDNRN